MYIKINSNILLKFVFFVVYTNSVFSFMNKDNTYSLNEIIRGNLLKNDFNKISVVEEKNITNISRSEEIDSANPDIAFEGVYYECVLFLSYTCIQKKTLEYLRRLNYLKEVTFLGNYVKFVKVENVSSQNNATEPYHHQNLTSITSHELSLLIDDAVEMFFDQHSLRIGPGRGEQARMFDEVMGRAKKRKGGGHGGGGHGGGGDGGKKKMMMMAMMCMKMKMMMMVPAMMGIMGMMSFKGMMFGMMSFMIAKMMLLMKLLQSKGVGGGGGGHSGGGDSAWAGGSGGQWVPAGGSGGDGYGAGGGGGGGGGYNAAGEWQSGRSMTGSVHELIPETSEDKYPNPINITSILTHKTMKKNLAIQETSNITENLEGVNSIYSRSDPEIRFTSIYKPEYNEGYLTENGPVLKKSAIILRKRREAVMDKLEFQREPEVSQQKGENVQTTEIKSRKKRGIVDILAYMGSYWAQRLFNTNLYSNPPYKRFLYPKNRIINGMRYEYFPYSSKRNVNRNKYPKMVIQDEDKIKNEDDNKLDLSMNIGETEAVPMEADSRMFKVSKKNKNKMKDMQEIVEDNPWE